MWHNILNSFKKEMFSVTLSDWKVHFEAKTEMTFHFLVTHRGCHSNVKHRNLIFFLHFLKSSKIFEVIVNLYKKQNKLLSIAICYLSNICELYSTCGLTSALKYLPINHIHLSKWVSLDSFYLHFYCTTGPIVELFLIE